MIVERYRLINSLLDFISDFVTIVYISSLIAGYNTDVIVCRTVSTFKKHLDNYIFNQELI